MRAYGYCQSPIVTKERQLLNTARLQWLQPICLSFYLPIHPLHVQSWSIHIYDQFLTYLCNLISQRPWPHALMPVVHATMSVGLDRSLRATQSHSEPQNDLGQETKTNGQQKKCKTSPSILSILSIDFCPTLSQIEFLLCDSCTLPTWRMWLWATEESLIRAHVAMTLWSKSFERQGQLGQVKAVHNSERVKRDERSRYAVYSIHQYSQYANDSTWTPRNLPISKPWVLEADTTVQQSTCPPSRKLLKNCLGVFCS